MDFAFQYYIQSHNKAMTETSYSYTAHNGYTCKYNANSGVASVTGFHDVQHNSPSALLSALQSQPISIGVDAQSGWQTYGGGIMQPKKGFFGPGCSGGQLDHGVLLVGSGTANGVKFWKIKNSWGTG